MSKPQKPPSNLRIILFISTLSFVCALILSVLASVLKEPQEVAKELDRSEQMLIAARIFDHNGYFLIKNDEGEYIRARHVGEGVLIPSTEKETVTQSDILAVYKRRLEPFVVNAIGDASTFSAEGIDLDSYLVEHKKTGYHKEPWKLIYKIFANPTSANDNVSDKPPIGYLIHVNGFGLWDAIYGYIAIKPDGASVIGISWYEHKETPGLGANIADAPWQSNFPGKSIFQPSASGDVDLKTAPIGISVVKGKVAEVIGDLPKARSAVDGMPGATLTGNGVTTAYREVLSQYRPFFIKIRESEK